MTVGSTSSPAPPLIGRPHLPAGQSGKGSESMDEDESHPEAVLEVEGRYRAH